MKKLSILLFVYFLSFAYAEEKVEKPLLFRGFYLGVNIPYGVDYYIWKETSSWTGGDSFAKETLSAAGFIPGGRIGYEYAFSNRIFLAFDLSGNYIYRKVKSSIDGNYVGSSYLEENSLWRNGQFVFVGHFGGLISEKTVLYFIGGGEYTKIFLNQEYKFTTMNSSISTKNSKNLWGGLIGIGIGTAVTDHLEVRLEFTKSYFPQFSFSEIHTSLDKVTLNTHQIYGNFSIIYRF